MLITSSTALLLRDLCLWRRSTKWKRMCPSRTSDISPLRANHEAESNRAHLQTRRLSVPRETTVRII
jgi:hypothetical protein